MGGADGAVSSDVNKYQKEKQITDQAPYRNWQTQEYGPLTLGHRIAINRFRQGAEAAVSEISEVLVMSDA